MDQWQLPVSVVPLITGNKSTDVTTRHGGIQIMDTCRAFFRLACQSHHYGELWIGIDSSPQVGRVGVVVYEQSSFN